MRKRFVQLMAVLVILFATTSQADTEDFSLSVSIQPDALMPTYVLLRSDGSKVHEPVQHCIYEVRGSSESIEVYACFIEDPNNHDNDHEMLGIYIASEDYFSGFIYQDVQWSEGFIVAAYEERDGYLDMEGNVVIPFQWATASPFQDGIAEVTYETSYGYAIAYIDTSGTIVALQSRDTSAVSEFAKLAISPCLE